MLELQGHMGLDCEGWVLLEQLGLLDLVERLVEEVLQLRSLEQLVAAELPIRPMV